MTLIKYEVGDFIFLQNNPKAPFNVKKIKSIFKEYDGKVKLKTLPFYRRKDLNDFQLSTADKNLNSLLRPEDVEGIGETVFQQLRSRELFISHQDEICSAQDIQGKCNVIRYHDKEDLAKILSSETETFFYHSIFEPSTKKLQNVRSFVRIGNQFQATIDKTYDPIQPSYENDVKREEMVWNPELITNDVFDYILNVISLAMLARQLRASFKEASLDLINSAAVRDITIQLAHDILHEKDYQEALAIDAFASLISDETKVLDQYEQWTIQEGHLFEEAMVNYGKNFGAIQHDILPWKSTEKITEFYYFWKTCNLYAKRRYAKLSSRPDEQLTELHLEKPLEAKFNHSDQCIVCESGPTREVQDLIETDVVSPLCSGCWRHWKRFGHFQMTITEYLCRNPGRTLTSFKGNLGDYLEEGFLKKIIIEDPLVQDKSLIIVDETKEDIRNFFFFAKNPMKFARRHILNIGHRTIRQLSRNPMKCHGYNLNFYDWRQFYKENGDKYEQLLPKLAAMPSQEKFKMGKIFKIFLKTKNFDRILIENTPKVLNSPKTLRKSATTKRGQANTNVTLYRGNEEAKKRRLELRGPPLKRVARRPFDLTDY